MARILVRPIKVKIIPSLETNQYSSYPEYLASPRWVELREYALERDGRRCRICNSSKFVQVHHRKYPKNWGEETVEDLTSLCDDCHGLFSLTKKFSNKIPIRKEYRTKKGKIRRLGHSNSRAASLLVRQGKIPNMNGYTIERTAQKICEIKGVCLTNGKSGKMEIIKAFCKEHD